MLRNSHRSVKAGIWIIFGQTTLRHSSHRTRGEPSKADLGIKAGLSRESLIPEPFTLRKSTARKAMVKVIITLAYSSAGSFCRVGREPWGRREKVSAPNPRSLCQGHPRRGGSGFRHNQGRRIFTSSGITGILFPSCCFHSSEGVEIGQFLFKFLFK